MENDQGDLADIVRASGGGSSSSTTGNNNNNNQQQISTDWQFPSKPIKFPSSSAGIEEDPVDNFGDPFSSTRDPLLQELEDIATARSGFFENSNSLDPVKMNVVAEDDTSICSSLLAQRILDEEMKRPCNIFSRMLQISPNTKMPVSPIDLSASASPSGTSSSSCLIVNNDMVVNKASSSTGCSVDNSAAVVQISSPRNTGIKRRKSQAKKVVCIPAPAAANSRPSGEVVPSDLWAWRKYGQKPIKGSPYPRGYYRCSSSKGCSARKQVERSRTDPNMLVITYTSEHNHPWPTQRNALAGSTRSHQPTKQSLINADHHGGGGSSSSKIINSSSSPSSGTHQSTRQKLTNLLMKDEEQHKNKLQNAENNNNINNKENSTSSSSIVIAAGGSVQVISSSTCSIKEEMGETTDQNKQPSLIDDHMCDIGEFISHRHHQGFHHDSISTYGGLPDDDITINIHHSDDFFSDLGELEPHDPLNLLFSSPQDGFTSVDQKSSSDEIKIRENKIKQQQQAALDPFSLFDWTGNNHSFGEESASRRGRGL